MMAEGSGDAPIDLRLLPRTAAIDGDGRLSIGGCDLAGLARTFGTPLYVYDEDELRGRCREYRAAFGDGAVAYAAKAFLCVAMAHLVADEGLHLDVATGGEAYVAQRAGFPAGRMVFHGNNKSELELRLALELGVGRLVVDGIDELDRIEVLVASGLPRPRVLVRVTPGVEAHTHEYIATGADDSKFGFTVSSGAARDAAVRVAKSDAMDLVGFHCHIGSQILVLESYARTASIVAELAAEVAGAIGQPIEEINLGGGLGVPYTPDDLDAPPIAGYASFVRRSYADACAAVALDPAPRLAVEAGRSIAGPAGLTLYSVGSVKEIVGVRTYVAVDGGMSDNPRPVTYGARYEAFIPARAAAPRPFVVSVAGKHCEQGDILVKDAHLPTDLAVGDVLATPVTGAYSHSMASNYNLLPRAAVVFVREGNARVVVRRETFEDLVTRDHMGD
jgi:diaminopimelate decarboxylase